MPEDTGTGQREPVTPPHRALAKLPPVQMAAATEPSAQGIAPFQPGSETLPPQVLFIPGDGVPTVAPVAAPAPRRRKTHLIVAAAGLAVLLVALITFTPISGAVANAANPFSALAASLKLTQPPTYVNYRVQPGDTYARIAARFGVALGGIFKLNQFYAGQEPQIGQVIRVPTDPAYGANYIAPPLVMNHAGGGTPLVNYLGSCLFCAAGGWTNGPSQPCAPEGAQPVVDVTQFDLVNPDPNSHWVRGFRWDHNGVDISTGQEGTPLVAAQAGVVIYAAWDPFGAGWAVKINHCGGFATSYSHLEKLLVSPGEAVQAGQLIGLQGMTGNSTGPHLHFMIWWNNIPYDPLCAYASIDGVSSTDHYGGCPAPQATPGN